VQDTWRFTFMALGRPRAAAGNDAVWAVGAIALLAGLGGGPGELLGAWGAAAFVAAVAAGLHARFLPDVRGVRSWLACHRDLWPRYVAEFLTIMGAWQLALVGLGLIAGLDAVGALRAGQVLVGPLNVVFLAVPLVVVPESARLWSAGRGTPREHARWVSALLATIAVGWGLVIALLPNDLGTALLGSSWAPARSVLVPLVVVMAAMGVNLGPFCALRALRAAREGLWARLVAAPAMFVAPLIGGAIAAASGAAWGWAAATLLAIPIWLVALARADTATRPVPQASGVEPAWSAQ
jgi:O-antigen/teichoic acid export membrane protein